MYRKHQRMEAEQKYAPQFVQRVLDLPSVSSAADQVASVYSRTKEFNPLLKYGIETAENAVKYGAETAKPLITKLEKPISIVDGFACDQLTKLENSYPIITKPTAEIVASSKNAIQGVKSYGVDKVNNVKQYGHDKVNNVKNYGYDKALTVKNYGVDKMNVVLESEVGKGVVTRVEKLVTIAEKYLDSFIPPVGCDSKEVSGSEVPNNTVQRLVVLSNKATNRLHCHALLQVEKLRNKALGKVEELKSVLAQLKDKTLSSAKAYNDRVQNLWKELTKEEEENESKEIQNWREKLLQKARVLTKSLSHIFTQASNIMSYFSSITKQRFIEARNLADSLYNTFKSISGAAEISDAVISYSQETLQKLQESLISLGTLVPGLNKVVPLTSSNGKTSELSTNAISETAVISS